jgi:uncharacterized protein HemX
MKKTKKIILLITILILGIGSFSFFLYKNQKTENSQTSEKEVLVEEQNQIDSIFYTATADGQNAFELLKENAEVEYQQYDFGVFVESINGINGDDKHFWAVYLNDEQAQVGAEQIILQKDDRIEWKYEEIK